MKLKRFLTDEEFLILKELSNKKELISKEAYTRVKKNKDTEAVTNILKDIIEGFYSFSCFTDSEKIRIQYNWNYNNKNIISFEGVGYITITELKKGFKEE